jgi:hypothetical protein
LARILRQSQSKDPRFFRQTYAMNFRDATPGGWNRETHGLGHGGSFVLAKAAQEQDNPDASQLKIEIPDSNRMQR